MSKISIKREQSQAGLSFAEREKFRPQVKNKLLLLLVLLVAVATGAWAQTETLLTTITATAKTTYSETTAGVVTVTPSGQDGYNSYGWSWRGSGSVTVEAKEGYTITKCLFSQPGKTPVTISSSPFAITFNGEGYCVQNDDMDGVKSIEVYGYVTPAPTGYSITLDEGTGNKDSQNWEITPKSSELSGNEAVTVKYNGSREVKSVTVVKKAEKAADNTYLAWDGTQKKLVATPMPESFTTVTSENTQWSAGTYVVEGQVDINGTIVLTGDVNLIIKDGAKLDVYHLNGNSHNLSIFGQASQTGELDVNCSGGDAINDIPTLEVHSAKVTATSSSDYSAGFFNIGDFNVYGGLVDAKGTAAAGGSGIYLKVGGSMNIYGGEVKAEGTGNNADVSYGITSGASTSSDAANVRVYGGKLWAGCADNQALNNDGIYLTKGTGFTGKIEYSSDNNNWSEEEADTKYVRVGY